MAWDRPTPSRRQNEAGACRLIRGSFRLGLLRRRRARRARRGGGARAVLAPSPSRFSSPPPGAAPEGACFMPRHRPLVVALGRYGAGLWQPVAALGRNGA